MAARIAIPIVQDVAYPPDTRVELEIDGVVQPDLVWVWPPGSARSRMGFGFGHPDLTPFGGVALAGESVGLGLGAFGVGASLFTHRTRAAFPNGVYTVRVRAIDALGNPGAWSEPVLVDHREHPPPPPRAFRLNNSTGLLVWEHP